MIDLATWLKSGKYLPSPMRDFHDQKLLFKRIQEMSDRYKWLENEQPCFRVSMCYTIDVFLWFMAMHGYTLQRSRQRIDGVKSLEDELVEFEERQRVEMHNCFIASRSITGTLGAKK